MSESPEYRNNDFKTARNQLASLGLTLEELGSFGSVLDIGAKDCEIQKAAIASGIRSVISVDKHFSEAIKGSGLSVLENNANQIDVPSGSVDLAIVRSSAYYYTKTEDETWKILCEINRVLKAQGKQRVYPARFGHIIQNLLDTNESYASAKAKAPERRSHTDLKIIQSFENIVNIKTKEFLDARGIFSKMKEGLDSNSAANFKDYLIIDKF